MLSALNTGSAILGFLLEKYFLESNKFCFVIPFKECMDSEQYETTQDYLFM